MEKAGEIVGDLSTADKVLKIRNINSSFCSFYELHSYYMFVLEEVDSEKYLIFNMISPHGFEQKKGDLLASPAEKSGRVLHQHEFFEFMFVLKGSCIQKIENHEYLYHAGQCCLLNHNVRHVEIPTTEETELFFLMLSDMFLDQLMQNDLFFEKNGQIKKNWNDLYQLFSDSMKTDGKYEKQYWDFYPIMPTEVVVSELEGLFGKLILENKKMEMGSYLMIQAITAKIFSMLLNPSVYSIYKTKPDQSRFEHLFSQIRCILEEHHGLIDRAGLAKALNYNPDYLNRVVKHCTGKTLLEYSRVFTLKEAARLLVWTDMSISSIMSKLELSNRTTFYKSFKKQYGMTPNHYRKQAKTFHPVRLDDLREPLGNLVLF